MQLFYRMYMGATGYSISAQEYVLAMHWSDPDLNIKIDYMNVPTGSGVSDKRKQLFESFHRKPVKKGHTNIYHCVPMRYRRPKGAARHVGVCVYETIDPPVEWVSKMNEMDVIITPSTFNKHVYLASGLKKPIEVVPHCFDPNMFNGSVRPRGRFSQFTFVSIGTFKKRKNFEPLIKGFYEAFSASDNVCLLIKTDKPADLRHLVARTKKMGPWRSKETAPIYAEDGKECIFEEIPRIMKKADAYISTSMGEGFGYGGLHAMALGIPVITTKFGGCLEYALPELCTYLEPEKYEKVETMDGVLQFQGRIWPVLSTQEISKKLRYVLGNQRIVTEKAKLAYEFAHKNFTYASIGPKFTNVLFPERG